MKLFKRDFTAKFIKRPNRFIIHADLDGNNVICHCPNTGRMGELLLPGATIILEKSSNPARKTKFSVVAVKKGSLVVPITSVRANRVARELIIPELYPGAEVRSEVTYGDSRFDFMLKEEDQITYIEVKSCTLFHGEDAVFPDAPTSRGVKHMKELHKATEEGYRAAIILVVFNPLAKCFYPNYVTDPLFAETMERISGEVSVIPYRVGVDEEGNIVVPNNPRLPVIFHNNREE